MITIHNTPLPGVILVEPEVHGDERGFFMETYNQADFANAGLPEKFVQDNHSRSSRGVLRGLHFQYPQWQGKLVRVIAGEIFDVAVDIRRQSPHHGLWHAETLSAQNKKMLYIPPGYAHGFCVTSESAEVVYKCTSLYKPAEDRAVRWDDPDIAIAWPVTSPVISEKDAKAPLLRDVNID